MGKSLVVCYIGGRGSGKTLSMTAEMSVALASGKKVWSNYPISFLYENNEGNIREYKSTLIDVPDLLAIQSREEIRDGYIALDEWNLFINSRRSASMANQIFAGIVQLIRKRKLSFFISCQRFATLDINIRWQADVLIHCFDLSFKYRNLPEGAVISQTVTDWSGVLCGKPLWGASPGDPDWERNTKTRMLKHASNFWHCYNSFEEYDVLDVMSTSYDLGKRKRKNVRGDEQSEKIIETQYINEQIANYRDRLIYENTFSVSTERIRNDLKEYGVDEDFKPRIGRLLRSNGFIYRQTRRGNYYDLEVLNPVA